ncbi:MAG TPA: membrane-bound lytic murein transglycosylase MltF [Methylothermaceae bacterium]|nr:membrane-bound lytic murein transglycosylase MltF [Methylothermaceae bacterium]
MVIGIRDQLEKGLVPVFEPAPPSRLQRIKASGKLRVLTVYGATTYYPVAGGFAGFDYELASRFADWLGVRAEFVVADSVSDLLARMIGEEADLAAAGLTVTDIRSQYLAFSEPYQEVTEQLIYLGGNRRPRGIDDLREGFLEVMASSSHARTLERLRLRHPHLTWSTSLARVEELLRRVQVELIDYTIIDSNQFAVLRRFFPRLKVAFDLDEPAFLAWAFVKDQDDSLLQAANRFLQELRRKRVLDQLLERYYGHVEALGFVDVCVFQRHVRQRLPRFRRLFEDAGSRYGWDWRLLAAVAYQESHWDIRARSPTGVQGLMMLTQQTARQLGVRDRLDPKTSIFAAARYLKQLRDKIPERIPEPDRTWFALAAYNIGFGHLEDARVLTQAAGKDPDRWIDVKRYLPLLAKRQWYSRVKHGYARGWEPVRYVENIRNYHDLLVQLETDLSFSAAEEKNPLAALRRFQPAPPPPPEPGD